MANHRTLASIPNLGNYSMNAFRSRIQNRPAHVGIIAKSYIELPVTLVLLEAGYTSTDFGRGAEQGVPDRARNVDGTDVAEITSCGQGERQ